MSEQSAHRALLLLDGFGVLFDFVSRVRAPIASLLDPVNGAGCGCLKIQFDVSIIKYDAEQYVRCRVRTRLHSTHRVAFACDFSADACTPHS